MADQTYFIAFWNVENLFAPQNFPDRSEKIKRAIGGDLRGWTTELFKRKVSQLARIIRGFNNGGGPDICGLAEIENRFVLDRLVEEIGLPSRDYDVLHADGKDQRGIDCALLYDRNRLSADPEKVFHHFVMRRTATRDLLQCTLTTRAGRNLVVFVNHWPSRSGGAEQSAGYRMIAGETLSYFHERCREFEPEGEAIPAIAIGDFNDEPADISISVHALGARIRKQVTRSRSVPRFLNLSWFLYGDREVGGTFYFDGDDTYNLLDQVLVSKGLLVQTSPLRVLEETLKIERPPEMTVAGDYPRPRRFGLPKGNPATVDKDGFSDHFPVSVAVRERV
jgi:endonuclease/exonuclease/phosphatase family metal-dependent hydrolase